MIEEDLKRIHKGPHDLEEQIEHWKKRAQEAEGELSIIKGIGNNSPEMKALQKQKEFLQGKCRQAGRAILDQELTIKGLKKEIDRLSEENFNLGLVRGNNHDKK
jgi:chromosome segregation ATPase|tara:strand:- start:517 stop:828 length:312 start_codon:yes stop_codon:yes gene_type:complete